MDIRPPHPNSHPGALAKDLTRRGVRALEAFGRVGENLPPGGCVVPADFLLAAVTR